MVAWWRGEHMVMVEQQPVRRNVLRVHCVDSNRERCVWECVHCGIQLGVSTATCNWLGVAETLYGTAARILSKALCRSVVTITIRSPSTYVSRTLPWWQGDVAWWEKQVEVKKEER